MFDRNSSLVNEVWTKELTDHLIRLPPLVALVKPDSSHTRDALDLPISWTGKLFARAKSEYDIPIEAELPLLWMPESAVLALDDYRQAKARQDGVILRGHVAASVFCLKVAAYTICAMASFWFWTSKSLAESRLRSRIQGIRSRLLDGTNV